VTANRRRKTSETVDHRTVVDVERCEMRWYEVENYRPNCDLTPDSFGVQVQIYPRHESPGTADAPVAFFGCRVTDTPNFYLHGRCIEVTHFAPLLQRPK